MRVELCTPNRAWAGLAQWWAGRTATPRGSRGGPPRPPAGVEDGRHVVRVRALELEGDGSPAILRGQRAEDGQPRHGLQGVERVTRDDLLVPVHGVHAEVAEVVEGGAEADRLHDRRRAGLELVR